MALSDQQMQFLQGFAKTKSMKNPKIDDPILHNKDTGQIYKIINRTPGDPNSDDVTQAIAVAPMDKNGNVDYSQTAIVVAGTQPDNPASLWNAIRAGWDPTSSISAQTQDIRNFYQSTKKIVQQHPNGYISNMSGFSQAGPPVAKVACEQQVPHITNFNDWAAKGASNPYVGLFRNLPHEYLTDSDIKYLNTHAHVYLDAYRALTSADFGGGMVPYGKQFIVQSSDFSAINYIWNKIDGFKLNIPWLVDHSPALFQLKNNGLDVDWYIQSGQFCSGMTYDQALKIAKVLAKKDVQSPSEIKLPESYYIEWRLKEYQRIYGDFAPENPYSQKLKEYNYDIKSYKSQLKSATGGQAISLREDLVKAVAQKASLQAEEYAKEVQKTLDDAKNSIENQIKEVRNQAYELGQHLSAWEIESMLGTFSLNDCWDSQLESDALAETKTYLDKMHLFSEKITAGADKIVTVDREGANLFNKEGL